MNRAERRAAMKRQGRPQAPAEIIIKSKRSPDLFYFILGIIGFILAMVWGYLTNKPMAYILAGFTVLETVYIGMRLKRK